MLKVINKIHFRHLSWNLFSGVIAGGLTVLATGVMVRSLGYEGFGVVSIWIMLQGAIQLFDFGIGTALNRELTKNQGRDSCLLQATSQFYKLNGSLWAIVTTFVLIYLYGWASSTPRVIMVAALAIQFQTLRCSAILMANARYDDLAKSQIFSNIIKYGGAIVVVSFTDSLSLFFLYQLVAAWLGFVVFNQFIPEKNKTPVRPKIIECIKSLSMVSRQSLSMWLTALVSVGITSSDRTLIGFMDGSLSIGKYSAALTAASLVNLITLPFYRVYFTEYSSTYFNNQPKLLEVFSSSCQQLTLLVTLLGIVAYFCAESFFYIWLGFYDEEQIITFKLLLVGMAFASFTWLPGALCQATGKSAIHIWVMAATFIISFVVAIPSIERWGYPGASAIWLIHGVLGAIFQPYLINKYVFPINLMAWYRKVYFSPAVMLGIAIIWVWICG